MALNRQKILNELGSVMNQLQSADCGCMGKLFGGSNQNVIPMNPTGSALSPCGGYRHGCNHGYGWNSMGPGGESYTQPNQQSHMNHHCMGHCNPPKLYADTYNYLNDNLMKPTLKEVYDDLKSITPANTIMNNPLANQMGLSNEKFGAQANVGDMSKQLMMGNQNNANMTSNIATNNMSMPNPNSNQILSNTGGMGPHIMSMLGGSNQLTIPSNVEGKGQLSGPMVIDAPQSPHGQIGVTPLSPLGNAQNYNNAIPRSNQSPLQTTVQYGGNIQNAPGTQQILNTNANPAAQQMAAPHRHPHGQHAQGIAKFNEMFPGVTQGLGGDLGFDPMAIAIQMNPANHQQAAMKMMHNVMNNNKGGDNTAMQPRQGVTFANHPQSNVQTNQAQGLTPTNQIINPQTPSQQQQITPNAPANFNIYGGAKVPMNQQVYSTVAAPNSLNQQQYQQQDTNQQLYQETMVDPNTGGILSPPTLATVYEGVTEPQHLQQLNNETPNIQQRIIKEPIFPVDTNKFITSKPKQYEYNTLGQPIEMLPAKNYHAPVQGLPQTLSPQDTPQTFRNNPGKYSNVKSTMSKTSLMGNKPVGKVPSRNQLQHIYNQYKGSQSFTQQNARAADNGVSQSDGRLNVQTNPVTRQGAPLEKIAGDTVANNQFQEQRANKIEQVIGQIGDVPVTNKPIGDVMPERSSPIVNRKSRNGLQDVIYTSYPTSTAWSFHGERRQTRMPYSAGHRYRNRM